MTSYVPEGVLDRIEKRQCGLLGPLVHPLGP